MRRLAIVASAVRQIGGAVFVVPVRDRDGGEVFAVRHISGGGDITFLSQALPDQDRAQAAADVLAAYTGAVVK